MELTGRLATCYIKEAKAPASSDASFSFAPRSKQSRPLFNEPGLPSARGNTSGIGPLNHCYPIQDRSQEKTLIALEKGYHLFHLGDWQSAQHVFSSISLEESDPLPYGWRSSIWLKSIL